MSLNTIISKTRIISSKNHLSEVGVTIAPFEIVVFQRVGGEIGLSLVIEISDCSCKYVSK